MGKERGDMHITIIPLNRGVVTNTSRELYPVTPKPVEPLMTDKLSVCRQADDMLLGQDPQNTLHEYYSSLGGRITALRQKHPQKRIGCIALYHRDHQDIHLRRANLQYRTVDTEDESSTIPIISHQQDDGGNMSIAKIAFGKERWMRQ